MNNDDCAVITLNYESQAVIHLMKKDPILSKVIKLVGPIEYKLYNSDKYVFLVDTIIGQMLSNKVADIICNRLHNLCNNTVTPEKLSRLSFEQFRSTGLSRSKIEYIGNLTNAILSGSLNLDGRDSLVDEEIIESLTKVRGIGLWSAKMFLIFVLNRPNILPLEDTAFLQSFCWAYEIENPKKSLIKEISEIWKPYSSIASRYLYKALDLRYTKTPFREYKQCSGI